MSKTAGLMIAFCLTLSTAAMGSDTAGAERLEAVGAEIVNVNPDKNDDPWLLSPHFTLSADDLVRLEQIPRLRFEMEPGRDLPTSVDNSTQPYLRPVFTQSHGSCGQASGIGYAFTYEINYARDLVANITANQYPTHFTYNFLNFGSGGQGSLYLDGWDIIRHAGCPNVIDYGGLAALGERGWMDGYDKYYNAMFNKSLEVYAIEVDTPEGINTLKRWLYDHGGCTRNVGGLACFAAGISVGQYTMTSLPSGTPHEGRPVVIEWDHQMNHEMTIVGYDDSICYDFNGDGQYTNDVDINGDSLVDVRDWEIGGVYFVNSWGMGWADGGKAFMMYKLLADPLVDGGIMENTVHVLRAKETSIPQLTMKVQIEHNRRSALKLVAGVSNNLSDTEPETVIDYPVFTHQGGAYSMQGGSAPADRIIEIGIDLTPLLGTVTPGEPAVYFLQVFEDDPLGYGNGQIISCSLVDYNFGGLEVPCPETNVTLINDGATTLMIEAAVDYTPLVIETESLPPVTPETEYEYQLTATGGTPPYKWHMGIDYTESPQFPAFPAIEENLLTPTATFWGYAVQDLEFSFPFYGEESDQIVVFTDGVLFFNDSHVPLYTENSIRDYRCIVPFGWFMSIVPQYGEGIWYEGDENQATFRWRGRLADINQAIEIAVTLTAEGEIDFHYSNTMPTSQRWVAGISAGDGENFTIASVSGSNDAGNQQIRFTPPEYPVGMNITSDGRLTGMTKGDEAVGWAIPALVVDANNITVTRELMLLCNTAAVEGPDFDYSERPRYLIPLSSNPGTPPTSIRYTNPVAGFVNLRILDLNGRLVRTLVSEVRDAGSFTPLWDGRNDSGQEAGSGIYYYQLQTITVSETRKVVLIR